MVQINWTESAKEDLKNIAEYISRDSLHYALKQVEKFYEAVEVLHGQPKIGRPVPEYELPDIRQILVGKYRIIYRIVSDTQIDIIAVHHGSRLLNLDI